MVAPAVRVAMTSSPPEAAKLSMESTRVVPGLDANDPLVSVTGATAEGSP